MTTVKDLQGIKGRMTRPVGGCPFHPRCTQAWPSCADSVPELAGGNGRKVACHRGGIVTLLSVNGLSIFYDGFKAVDSVDLDVRSGETVAVVGQSGSGKTTLAKSIIGLLKPSSGRITVEGEAAGKDYFKRVQMIFQNPGNRSATGFPLSSWSWNRWTCRASGTNLRGGKKR
jgi:peptide/nickel transport system ATP-binding protein